MKKTRRFWLSPATLVLAIPLLLAACTSLDTADKATTTPAPSAENKAVAATGSGSTGTSSSSNVGGGGSGKSYKIGLSTQDLENQYWIELENEFKNAAKEKGVEVFSAAKYDPAEQAKIVENFMQQGVNAIVVSPVDPVAMEPVFKEAKKKGIKVINNHFPADQAAYDVFLDTGAYESGILAGTWAAEYINKNLGGQAEVAVLTLPENSTITTRVKGIIDAVRQKAPNAKIVSEQRAQSREQAVTTTTNILTANPKVNVLLGWSDSVMLGAVSALEGLNKDPSKFGIVGIDAVPEALDAISKGKMKATVDNPPRPFGKLAFNVAYDLIINTNSPWNTVKHAITKLNVVDETNVKDFIKK